MVEWVVFRTLTQEADWNIQYYNAVDLHFSISFQFSVTVWFSLGSKNTWFVSRKVWFGLK